ncbi:hypothetical protein BH09GEM1_BH09GEM1_32740 [soil metagenome]
MADAEASRATDVCYVNAQGEFICDVSVALYDAREEAPLRAAIESYVGSPVSLERYQLIARLAMQVVTAPISDACVATRADDAVGSMKVVLGATPPVMLLYRYDSLPGDILSAYYMQEHKVMNAYDAQAHWSTHKPAC